MNNNSARAVAEIPGYLAGTWKIDTAHSGIAFAVRALGTRTRGRFTNFDIRIVTGDDPSNSSVTATIDLASIDTGNAKRDEHLRSATFLDVARHPNATYRSSGIRRAGDGWAVDGDLTMHGVTRPVPLMVAAARFIPGPNRAGHLSFSATAQVNRGEFGIDRYSGGGMVVGNKIPISLEITAVLQH